MLNSRLIHRRFAALVALLVVASISILFSLTACARQPSDLKIVDLQDHLIVRIDATGSVFDAINSKIAVINDREGSLTFAKDHKTIVFKNDPAIQRDNDRYIVKIGDGFVFEVKPDGGVLLDGKPYWRVFGYTQKETQKDRFMAAVVIIPLLDINMDAPDGVSVSLPGYQVKNAERDPAIRKDSIIWIPSNDEIYVGDERIPKADFASSLPNKVDEWLKRQTETKRVVYMAASDFGTAGESVYYDTIVKAIWGIINSREPVQQIGLIVHGSGGRLDRFLILIPRQTDPNEERKLNPLLLGVSLSSDLQVKLITGEYDHPVGPNSEAKGSLNDPSSLSQALARIFQQRKEQHVYQPGMETRTNLSEDERVEKTVVIKAYRACRYGDVIKLIDAVKGAGANPIVLQVDDLP